MPLEGIYAICFLFGLEKYSSIQLITVGPVIDLYRKFAAEKLARLVELYPDRVYSKSEFNVLLFGRKDVLGVGS